LWTLCLECSLADVGRESDRWQLVKLRPRSIEWRCFPRHAACAAVSPEAQLSVCTFQTIVGAWCSARAGAAAGSLQSPSIHLETCKNQYCTTGFSSGLLVSLQVVPIVRSAAKRLRELLQVELHSQDQTPTVCAQVSSGQQAATTVSPTGAPTFLHHVYSKSWLCSCAQYMGGNAPSSQNITGVGDSMQSHPRQSI
jgi:hypothetical protein